MVWTQCSSVNFVFNSIILVGRNPKYWKNDTDLTQQIMVEQEVPRIVEAGSPPSKAM